MSRPSGEHLTPISIRLPTDDLEWLRAAYPTGYQLKIREWIKEKRQEVEEMETLNTLERMYPNGK